MPLHEHLSAERVTGAGGGAQVESDGDHASYYSSGSSSDSKSRLCLRRWRYINLLLSCGILIFFTTSFLLCLQVDDQQQPICRIWSHPNRYPVIRNPPPQPPSPSPHPMPECPDYTDFARDFHEPGSGGPLNLPFQRPIEECRKFASNVIDSTIETISSKMADPDLARLFTNALPNTLDTTIQATECVRNVTHCDTPLSFVITGDIHAMWLRDSANQLLPYIDSINQDVNLKRLFLGLIHMQAQFVHLAPYANAFNEPVSMRSDGMEKRENFNAAHTHQEGVYEYKWEIDSLASFLGFSYRYWNMTGDDSFVRSDTWVDAVNDVLRTIQEQQEPTFDPNTGEPMTPHYTFTQNTDRPTETQFNEGIGNAVQRTGLVKSLFRPSDDATIFPFFIPGNAQMSVELTHISQMLSQIHGNNKAGGGGSDQQVVSKQEQLKAIADQSGQLAKEIRDAIYKYAVVDVPGFDKVFAYEVDGYGSRLIMDDANVPSLLSLPMLGFVDASDPVYQNTRKLVLSRANPYYFDGPRGSGIGGPHIGINYAWPMSQIVRILTSSDDNEIKQALDIILHSTDKTGLIHESFNVYDKKDPGKDMYTRSWFAWANGLFGQAILKIAKERPHLIMKK